MEQDTIPGVLSHGESDPDKQSLLVSVERAARLLGLGRTFTWELVRDGRLETVRFGRRVLVPRAALSRMIDRYRVSLDR